MFTAIKCNTATAMALLGGKKCDIGKMMGFALWEEGTIINPAFGKSNLDTIIQEGRFIGAIMPDTSENNDTDQTFSETILKVRTQQDPGRKGFAFNFKQPPCYHNELMKLNGSTNWQITPILDNGAIYGWMDNDGNIRPFDAKIFVGLYKLPIMGVEDSGTRVEVDLMPKGLKNWQNKGFAAENSEIDFTEVNPVAGINITLPILTAGQTTTSVKVSNICSDASIKGLTDPASWKIERNGVLENVTAVSVTAEGYTFTHAAYKAGDKIRFVTDKNGMKVIALDTNYYSGESMIKTVA